MPTLPSRYHVTIAASNGTAPQDGFIDHRRIEAILASPVGADGRNEASLDNLPPDFTFAKSQAKRRGNVRYDEVVAQLGFVANMYASSIVPGEASFAFDLLVEHGDGSLMTWDETAAPARVLLTDPQAVIQRCVARALVLNTTVRADVLDPTPATSVGVYGATRSVPRFGVRWLTLEVGALYPSLAAATAAVTVTAIDRPAT